MRIHRDERGQTIILVALSLPLLLGFVGIATDVGALFKVKRTMQTAADAAAIAGALNYKYGTWHDSAIHAATANGFTAGSGVTVDPEDGPTWPSSTYHGVHGYIEVTITKSEPTIFLSLFGHPSVTVTARAVAGTGPGTGCIYTTGPTDTTFTNNGGIDLEAPGCGLVVESSDPNAMVINGSSTVHLGSIGVVGGYTKHGGSGSVTPTPVQGIAPESDPLNFLPQFSFSSSTTTTGSGKNRVTTETYTANCASGYDCSRSPVTIPATCATTGVSTNGTYNVPAGTTLMPGCYAGLTFPSSGTVTLSPGLYLVDGDVTFNAGTVNGNGVTFYTNGNFKFNNGTYNLAPPNDTTQLYNGVMFAESLDDTNSITFGGNSNTVIKGIVYAPNTPFDMHGTPSITLDADFVVKKITLSGNVSFTSYAALSGVSSPLSTVVLVE